MNKPPERVRFIFDTKDGFLSHSETNANWYSDTTVEIFYTLEKPMKKLSESWNEAMEPMTQKTENLTVQEAWAAMARGECVKSGSSCLRRINDTELVFYDNDKSEWVKCFTIGMSPYSIVPDPSKPKEVEDLYKEDKSVAITCFVLSRSEEAKATGLIEFMERNFQRKP